MILTDNTQQPVIAKARTIFLDHYKDQEFLQTVRDHRSFYHTWDTADKIANKIRDANFSIELVTFNDTKTRAIACTNKQKGGLNHKI